MATLVQHLAGVDQDAHEILHDLAMATYLDGECYAFAIALNEGLEWPIYGLMEGNIVRHAVLKPPEQHYFDVRGQITLAQVGVPFGHRDPILCHTTPDVLRDIRPVSDRVVAHARKIAEVLWPSLPWKNPSTNPLLAFLDDLEAVCRKHGYWLRPMFPTAQPIVEPAKGDEEGFTLTPTSDGNAYMLDRRLTCR